MAKEIPLTQGMVALVDDEDFARLMRWDWFAVRGKHTHYAMRTVNIDRTRRARVAMHRDIMGAVEGQVVDHRSGNGLDNRKENLRICTMAENARNRCGVANTSSRFKGVSWHHVSSKWSAQIRVDGKQRHLGLFASEESAARAYDDAAARHFGEFARVNFPPQSEVA